MQGLRTLHCFEGRRLKSAVLAPGGHGPREGVETITADSVQVGSSSEFSGFLVAVVSVVEFDVGS